MLKRFKSVSLLLFLLTASTGTVSALSGSASSGVRVVQQNGKCSGVVKDATGETIIGASVVVKGTTNGTITGIDGDFTLPDVKKGDIIQVSFVGYTTQEVTWNGQPLNITLKEDTKLLDEVVITAYGGKQLRSKVTNSIAKVDKETIASGVHANPAQALSGAVAGLQVRQTSGDPGATPTLILRGGTSLDGSGSPLVIIDGAQRSMSDINPSDIESIEVMKDAGATAIYGARAANGVILVTTKRGKEGTAQIGVKAKFGLNYFKNNYEFLGAEDYIYWMRKSYQNASEVYKTSTGAWAGWTNMSSLTGAQPYGTGNIYFNADGSVADGNKVNNANWSVMKYSDDLAFLLQQGWRTMIDPVYGDKLIFKEFRMEDVNIETPALTQDYTIDFSGGNDKGKYYSSLGYYKSDGNATGNWYKRFTWTFNADYKLKKWLTSSSSLNFSHNTWYGIVGGIDPANYFSRVFSVPPTFRGTNADGEWLIGVRGTGDANVKTYMDALERDNNTDKFTMTQAFTVDIIKGLSMKFSGSWYYEDTKQEAFNHDYMTGVNRWYRDRYTSDYYNRTLNQTYNIIATYNGSYKNHNLNAMAGFEYYDQNQKGFQAEGYGAPTDSFQDLNLTDPERRSMDSWHSQNRIMSFFGKLDYDFDSKYLVSAVLRRDGYSRLAKDNRWGFFPGISAGWVFGKEEFMERFQDVISFSKVRFSYGANGNLDTGYIGNYTVQGAYSPQTKYNGQGTTLMSTLPNPNLRWEKSYTFEAGLDLGFFNNRYTLNMTFYNRRTKDKLAYITLPSHSGVSSILSNNGEVQNQGVEMEVTTRLIDQKDWKWNLNFNLSYNKNKVISLPNNGLQNNMQNAFQVYTGNGDEKIWVGGYQEGQEPGAIYGFKAEGIYQSYDEIPGNLRDISSGNNGSNNKPLYGPDAWAALSDAEKAKGLPIQPGDVKWKDVNGDGVIDNYDMVKLGSAVPHWTGGITTNVSWKGLRLDARFDYALGHKIFDGRTPWIMGNMQGTYNTITEVFDTWTEENPGAKYPKYVWADQLGKRNYARNNSSLFVDNASYLAIREISLSYNLPKVWVKQLAMENVVLNVSAQNLGYITGAKKVASPEYGANGMGGYPLPRTLIFGINVTF